MARDKTAKQIGEIIGVCEKTVRTYMAPGKCPHDRTGPRRRIMADITEVTAWLRSQKRTTDPGRPEPDDSMSVKFRKAKTLHEAYKAELAQLKIKEMKGLLHDTSKCKERHERHLRYFAGKLLDEPRSVSAELVGKTRAQIEKILYDRHVIILTELKGD